MNHLGRGDATDFKIADSSVSSSHCNILVNNGDVSIQDLGSPTALLSMDNRRMKPDFKTDRQSGWVTLK